MLHERADIFHTNAFTMRSYIIESKGRETSAPLTLKENGYPDISLEIHRRNTVKSTQAHDIYKRNGLTLGWPVKAIRF